MLLASDLRYLLHGALYAASALLLLRPQWLRPRRGRGRAWQAFALMAIWCTFVAMPLASLLRGDLHRHLVINGVLWLGAGAGLAAVWTRALRLRRWPIAPLLLATGGVALFEPGFVIVRSAWTGQWSGVIVLTPVLFAAHAALIAPIAAAWRDVLASPTAPPVGIGATATAAFAGGTAFLVGGVLWLAGVRRLLEALA
ncbi:MAG: hypothetical protein MUF30_06310 [Burkholderiales bacterium]|nr:hypothetical protein [Burkholderiales bacterium]